MKFHTSVDEIRRYCEDFWSTKRTYGCGDEVGCYSGKCTAKLPKRPPPPTLSGPQLARDAGGKRGGDTGGVNGGGGNDSGRGSSSAGGPN